jgi:nicotinate-nucleotide adenylyltransferase
MTRRHPDTDLVLLLGADSLLDLPGWRDPDGLLALATLAVAARPGFSVARVAPRIRARVTFLPNVPIDVSSRDLRARVRAGKSIRFLVPPRVERLVAELSLYRRAR